MPLFGKAKTISEKEYFSAISKIYRSSLSKIKDLDLNLVKSKFKEEPVYKDYYNWALNLEKIKKSSKKIEACHQIINKVELSFLKKNISSKCASFIKGNLKKLSAKDYEKASDLFLKWPYIFLRNAGSDEANFLKKISKKEYGVHLKEMFLNIFLSDEFVPSHELSKLYLSNPQFKSLHVLLGNNSKSNTKTKISNFKKKIKPIYNAGGTDKFEGVFKKKFKFISQALKESYVHLNDKRTINESFNFLAFLARNKKTKESREIIDILKENYSKLKPRISDAHFYYIWSYLQENKLKEAKEYIKEVKIVENFESHPSRLQFWTAKILSHSDGDKSKNDLLVKLIMSNPISYYGSVAAKELEAESKDHYKKIKEFYLRKSLSTYSQKEYLDFSKVSTPVLERSIVWAKYNLNSLLYNEIQELINENEDDYNSFVKLVSVRLHEYGLFLNTFQLLFQKMESKEISYDKDLLHALFPTPFKKEVESLTASIDSKIIMSLIRQESSFNPYAKSPVGALGLMQMMPYTAKRFDKKITKEKLVDYKTNLKLGLTYFIELNDRYESNLIDILSAYNAGERRIDSWRKTYLLSKNPLVNIEHIPFKETRKYIKLISRNKFFYDLLEDDEKKRSLASEK